MQKMDVLYEIANTIFTSILLHRLHDKSDHVRAICVEALYAWTSFDPVRVIKAEYLKYVGFAFSDYSDDVRIAALDVLDELLEVRYVVPGGHFYFCCDFMTEVRQIGRAHV
jgi:hypothetical protein